MGGSLSPLFTPDNSGDKTLSKRNLFETIKGAWITRAPSAAQKGTRQEVKDRKPHAYDDAPYQRFRFDGNDDNGSGGNEGNRRRPEACIEHPWSKQVVRDKGANAAGGIKASAWESQPEDPFRARRIREQHGKLEW